MWEQIVYWTYFYQCSSGIFMYLKMFSFRAAFTLFICSSISYTMTITTTAVIHVIIIIKIIMIK